MLKRTISLLLALVMVLGAIPMTAMAEETELEEVLEEVVEEVTEPAETEAPAEETEPAETEAPVTEAEPEETAAAETEAAPADVPVTAGTGVDINATNFPDAILREYVSNTYDANDDGVLAPEEVSGVYELQLSGLGISDLTGIEHFPDMVHLIAEDNKLTSVDFSKVPWLKMFSVQNTEEGGGSNSFTTLDLSCLPDLETIFASGTGIETLDFSNNPLLREVYVGQNNITSLDLSNNPKVENIYCGGNGMTSIDLSKCTELVSFVSESNDFATVNFSNCPKLEVVNLWSNKLTTLDLSSNPNLTGLDLGEGRPIEGDDRNNLTTLDLSANTKLVYVYCNQNQLTSLKLPSTTTLVDLNCPGNKLTTLDVSKNPNLTFLGLGGNQLTKLDVSNCTKLTELSFSENQVTSIDVSNCPDLALLECGGNKLTELDVSSNTNLEVLWVPYNNLTSLDLSKNTKLTAVNLSNNTYTLTGTNLSKLPGDFDVAKASNWVGATVSGTTLNNTSDTVTYTYDCGNGYTMDVELTIEEEVVLPVPAKPYKITNVVSGVHVYWKAVEGAEKYGLWRSETGKNGTYKWLANPSVPHFTDTTAVSGKTYHYKVTTMDVETKKHSEKSDSLGILFLSTPDFTSRTNKAAGVSLTWNKITGASGYAVYRKSYSGSDAWVRVGTIRSGSTLSWTDTSVKNNNGTVYRYTVRALGGSNLATLSGCRNTGRTMVRLTSRVLNSATKASSTAMKCRWTTSSAVTGYEIRFMIGSEVYKIATVTSYKTGAKTFTGLRAGETYKVQVRSYKSVAGVGRFYSAWSTAKTVSLG